MTTFGGNPVFQRDDEEVSIRVMATTSVILAKAGTRAVGEANIRIANGPQGERSESSRF